MAKVQTRRTISVSRDTFEDARAFAARSGVPLSQLCEHALRLVIGGRSKRDEVLEHIDQLKKAWGVGSTAR